MIAALDRLESWLARHAVVCTPEAQRELGADVAQLRTALESADLKILELQQALISGENAEEAPK